MTLCDLIVVADWNATVVAPLTEDSDISVVPVTGADGFTGRYLCAALAATDHEVHGLVPQLTGTTVEGAAMLHMADLTDSAALMEPVSEVRPARVAHLAAISFIAQGDIDGMYRVNLSGILNLLSALALQDSVLVVVLIASSANVYGNAVEGVIYEDCWPALLLTTTQIAT